MEQVVLINDQELVFTKNVTRIYSRDVFIL
jgi:hypothetical protein